MSDGESERVSFRADEDRLDKLDLMADTAGVSRSEMCRMMIDMAAESNSSLLEPAQRIEDKREAAKERNHPIDIAGGFADRVGDMFEQRFKSNYDPEILKTLADGYRQEARGIAEDLNDLDYGPNPDTEEYVRIVDEELEAVLEANDLSNWLERNQNRYMRFSGVEDAKERREYYVACVRGAIEHRENIAEAFNSPEAKGRDIRPDELPDRMDDDLPLGVDRDDVAAAANRLFEMGVSGDDVADALREFDPKAWDDDTDDEEPDDQPTDDSEPEDMDRDDTPNPDMTEDELIDHLADQYDALGVTDEARQEIAQTVMVEGTDTDEKLAAAAMRAERGIMALLDAAEDRARRIDSPTTAQGGVIHE